MRYLNTIPVEPKVYKLL